MADLADLLDLVDRAKSPADLGRIWRRAKPGFTRELTLKQRGQLAQMIKACGGSAPVAARALVVCTTRWDEFVARAEAMDGGRSSLTVPAAPRIGYLLQHLEAAVDFELADAGHPAAGMVDCPEKRAIMRHPVPEHASASMTPEERAAYLAKLGGS